MKFLNSKVSLHSWRRAANPVILWRPPLLPNPYPIFKFCLPPPSVFKSLHRHLQPPLPSVLSVFMFLWLNGWSRHIWWTILLNDNMDLYMSILGALVPEGLWCVFHETRRQVYWSLTHSVVFYWYSDLISNTHNTHHTQGPADEHTHINICLHHLLCAHSSYLYFIKWSGFKLTSRDVGTIYFSIFTM